MSDDEQYQTSQDPRQRWKEKKQRIERIYSRGKASFIWHFEDIWEKEYDENSLTEPEDYTEATFRSLYAKLRVTIVGESGRGGKAGYWYRRFQSSGYTFDDFVSVLWKKAWEICRDYWPSRTDYLLYETILVSLDNAVKDYLKLEKRRRESESKAWDKWKTLYCERVGDIDCSINRMFVIQMITDESLTTEEQLLLKTIYAYSDCSLREISEILGHANHKTAQRMLKRIREKLRGYESDA